MTGQVEDDKSIRQGLRGCPHQPWPAAGGPRRPSAQAFLVFKPHPDVEAGNRAGKVAPADAALFADVVAADMDIAGCIAAADGLATMTSLAGFEALLRGKPVWTFGRPFYAGWGLTHDALDFPGGAAGGSSLDELVAATLIGYPIYVHPRSGLPCGPEGLVSFLESRPSTSPSQFRYWRALRESLRTTPGALY